MGVQGINGSKDQGFSPDSLILASDFRPTTSDYPLLLMSYGQGDVNFINLLALKPYGLFNNSVFRLTTTIAFTHSPYLVFTFSPLHLFFRLPTSDFRLRSSDFQLPTYPEGFRGSTPTTHSLTKVTRTMLSCSTW